MAWQTPKTNWKQGDKVNMQDYNRWKNNITYLRELSLEVYKSYTLTDMGTDKAYTDYIYADEINTIEANLAALPRV